MKNEMERQHRQVADLKAEVIGLPQELKTFQPKSVIPQAADALLVYEKALHDCDKR